MADRQNKRIQIFDSEGKYLTEVQSLGTLAGQFGKPRDVAVDFLNKMYVVDKDNNNIQVFAPEKSAKSVQSVTDNDGGSGQKKTQQSVTDNDGGSGQKKTQQEFSTDPNSPTRHGKSYFTETFESEPDDPVYVVSHSTKKDKILDPIYQIVGEIKNKGDEGVSFVKIVATFYDKNGIVIGTDYTYTDPSDINSGRTAPVLINCRFRRLD